MRHSLFSSSVSLVLTALLAFVPSTSALRLIKSNSLNPCQDNSSFTASLFNVIFTPDNNTLSFNVVGVSSIQGNVSIDLTVSAYGYKVLSQTLDPCKMNLQGLCPMSTGQIDLDSNLAISPDVVRQIPSRYHRASHSRTC
jgi:hypothetical protein